MITNRDTLYKAAMGKQVKESPAPPLTQATPPPPRYPTAPGYEYNPSPSESSNILANLLASGTTGAGRSSKGKYSGFYSGGDLDAAIKGSAIDLRENVPAQLEAKAKARYQAMNQMYRQALGTQVPFTTEYDPRSGSAGNFRIAETLASTPSLRQARRNVSEYMVPLGSWYNEQGQPAEQYVDVAEKLRGSALSDLATSIATRQYGMNPNLAIGKFAGLDAEYFPTYRNRDYMSKYGKTYDQYKFEEEKAAQMAKEQEAGINKESKSQIESITGLSADKLATASGQTVSKMYEVLAKNYNVDGQQYSGSGTVQEIRDLLDSGNVQSAIDFVKTMQSTAGGQELSLLLNAMIKYYVVRPYQTEIDLQEAGYR